MIINIAAADLLANLNAALRWVPKKGNRPHLQQVRIEVAFTDDACIARFVSTNGHGLWLNEVRVQCDDKSASGVIQIHRDDVVGVVKAIKGMQKSFLTKDVSLNSDGVFAFIGGQVSFKPCELEFPPYEAIVSTNAESMARANEVPSLASLYLETAAASFADLCDEQAALAFFSTPVEKLASGALLPGPTAVTCPEAGAASALLILAAVKSDPRPVSELTSKYRSKRVAA